MSRLPGAPFAALAKKNRRRAMWALAGAEFAQLLVFGVLERRMKRTGGPGIIAFELAGSLERAQRITEAWGYDGRSAARLSLLLDVPFPATYALLQALACTATADGFADRGQRALAAAGGPLAWGQLAAAGFDYVENTALLLILSGRDGALPALARRAALTKRAPDRLRQPRTGTPNRAVASPDLVVGRLGSHRLHQLRAVVPRVPLSPISVVNRPVAQLVALTRMYCSANPPADWNPHLPVGTAELAAASESTTTHVVHRPARPGAARPNRAPARCA